MITQQRVPISAVSMTINGQWQSLKRSGDGFWQATQYDVNNPQVRAVRQMTAYMGYGRLPHASSPYHAALQDMQMT